MKRHAPLGPQYPKKLYRYFDRVEHAQRMAEGHIWLSTLEHVRNCDALRADRLDATMKYEVSQLDHNTPKSEADVIRARLKEQRVISGHLEGFHMKGVTVMQVVPHAYLLCMSSLRLHPRLRRIFGEHCVEIENPIALWRGITAALEQEAPLASKPFQPVTYMGRSYRDASPEPGVIGFASEPSLAYEKEFRMLWALADLGVRVQPRELHIPRANTWCRRIS